HGDRAYLVREGWRLDAVQPCGLEAAGASRLALANAPVAAIDDAARARAHLRTWVAALLVGAARGAHRYAMRYALERTAFGRPIAHHQALAFLIADLATAVDAARLAVWRAAAGLDRGESAEWEAACALADAPEPPDHPFFAMVWRMGLGQPLGVQERPGSRGGARRGVVLAEEMSYWDRGMSVAMPGLGLGGPPLFTMGTPEQKERFLAPFRDRERPHWAAFAMTEPGAGSDVAAIETTAVRDGDTWVLRGAKTFISNAMRADWIVVWATVDRAAGRAGHRAFIVERGTPGLEDMRHEHKMGLIAYESSSFTLRDCPVPAANLLGGERHYAERAGFKGAMKSFNATRPAIAAMAIGIARAAYDAARDFARSHYALDRPIPRYQRVRENLARMARTLEVGRLLCWRPAYPADIERGRAGLRGDLYQRMLAELAEQAKLADALGYDSISFTEHHFHVEGFELSNSPVLLDLFVGLQTKRIRVGQLGIVLPAHNPIRVAEEIAMLDHMTGGRANAGFARGYQRRWVDVMPQQTPHPPLFQPFASSERSIRWCAEEGVTAILPPLHPSLEDRLVRLYAEVSGRPLGEGVGVLRDVIVAPTDDEALALWGDSGAF